MEPEIVKEFEQVIDKLLELNKKLREQHEKTHPLQVGGLLNWLFNFCTVQCNIGRASGKTHYVNKNAERNDLIIVGQLDDKRYYYKAKAMVLSVNEINMHNALKGEDWLIDRIFIDDPTRCFKNPPEFDRFMHNLLSRVNVDSTIIMLGLMI